MHLPHALSIIIQKSKSLTEILDDTVRLIADDLGTDVCSIYLLHPVTAQLELSATHGLDKSAVGKVRLPLGVGLTGRTVETMLPIAAKEASTHPDFVYFPETREEQFTSYLGVPMVLNQRPVGAVVVQTREPRVYEEDDRLTLQTIAAQLVGVVENARLIAALDRRDDEWLRAVRSPSRLSGRSPDGPCADRELTGVPASPGIALAPVVVRGSFELGLEARRAPHGGEVVEWERITAALEKTQADILKIQKEAETQADEEHALIFSSHLLLLNDPVLLDRFRELVRAGANAAVAVDAALGEFGDRLRAAPSPYIRDRLEDILDLRSRLLGHLVGGALSPSVSDRIVACRNTPPSLVVELKAKGARGLVTEAGGATSHGALLARSLGIPAVTSVAGLFTNVRSGDHVIVDGEAGRVILQPTHETVERYEARVHELEERRRDGERYSSLPATTADRRRVRILANIGVAADLTLAQGAGAEGVGLYRTEFPFIIREQFPTREEQVRIYQKAYAAFPDAPIHFRLLDLGGDKFIAGGEIEVDRDSFASYRSIRVLLDHPGVLTHQVQAFALAAGHRELHILIPMVSTLDEVRRTRVIIDAAIGQLGARGAKHIRLGAMIELPGAVEIAGDLAKEVDFLSIGTNDLIQFALAMDRENSRSSAEHDGFHPAILRMIRRTIQAAHAEGRPVSVCGEIASDWRMAFVLLALGVDSISVTPSLIPGLKGRLARHSLAPLTARIAEILALRSARDIEEAVASTLQSAFSVEANAG